MVELPGDTKPSSGIAIANLVFTAISVVILAWYQVPLFSADTKLKDIDTKLKTIELAVAEQKAQFETLKVSFGAAESVLKLVQDFTPKMVIENELLERRGNYVEHTFKITNTGQYGIEQQHAPYVVILTSNLTGLSDCDPKLADPTIRDIVQPPPFSLLNPNTSVRRTVSFTLPSNQKDYRFCISFDVFTRDNMVRIAKKLLGNEYDQEIEQVRSATIWFGGDGHTNVRTPRRTNPPT